jgi:5-guanidino-2-oxopentanoate decarboxylase
VAERFESAPLNIEPDPAQIEAAVRLLAQGRRTLIIAGGGARAAGAELHRLVSALDCPLITTTAGKGVLPESHPANFGTCLPFEAARALAGEADLVLAVGTELAETDLFYAYQLPLNAPLIRIDVDPGKLADAYGAEVPILADARRALAAIQRHLQPRNEPGWLSALGGKAPLRASLEGSFDAKTKAMARALRAIKSALPHDAAIFTDMTQIAYFGNYYYPVEHPGQWFHPAGYGTLGYALPAALGAKVSTPARSVAALAGDFGLQFTLNELMTAVEARFSLPVLVWNNGALGQIRDDMVGAGIAPTGVVGENPDFVALARAYGAAAARVENPEALSAALTAALDAGRPTLIEIMAERFF